MICFICCTQETSRLQVYPEDTAISGSSGTQADSVTPYFPNYINIDNKKFLTYVDTLLNSMNSVVTVALQEKVLYNYYFGYDQYRFTWFRSFDPQ